MAFILMFLPPLVFAPVSSFFCPVFAQRVLRKSLLWSCNGFINSFGGFNTVLLSIILFKSSYTLNNGYLFI